jgi:Family of unknown function (DUF6580)
LSFATPPTEVLSRRQTAFAILCLVVIGVAARLLPHMPNFAPITATALFSGAYMSRRLSLLVPTIVMLVSDYVLLYVSPYSGVHFNQVYMPQALWHSALPYIYGSFAISAMVGWLLKKERSPFMLAGAALFCSLQFFAITNAAVWIEGAYDRGLNGLRQSYVAGIPFFKGTALGDLVYTFTFFAGFEALRRAALRSRYQSAPRLSVGAQQRIVSD